MSARNPIRLTPITTTQRKVALYRNVRAFHLEVMPSEEGLAHLGLIMGRPEDELQRFMNGEEPIDDDFVMKMRGIAGERGIDIS